MDIEANVNFVDEEVLRTRLSNLNAMAYGSPELLAELKLLEDYLTSLTGAGPRLDTASDTTFPPGKDTGEIAGLINALQTCEGHYRGAKSFELACSAALKYVFREDFDQWIEQSSVEEGFHRLDLLAHLKPVSQFWSAIRSDFRTRYVVFEFKNYPSELPQAAIYSTEKYLFTTALRSVAVLVARSGESKGARKARHGALRETGKLIITVSMLELIEMIEMRARGDEPSIILQHKLHDMLMGIGR
ncbi:hypothetical protein J2045_001314 [Peteryoungia aggregata LMG 23059]|uniref:Uncharacterized protein n=1 Tax=Peteryoungia aggregata LMG 23059 TaxID=1368425 RepID=A0ABU0G6J6_9HYPH|nr:hypothetical protein [Peteryoungia aggregata]MDQ0420295.1 hypothetical protein [Peteryoungia aggregata LMG 23059]